MFGWLLAPFVLTVLLRIRWRKGGRWVALVGVGVALSAFAWAQPEDAPLIAIAGYVLWLAGVSLAVALVGGLAASYPAGFRRSGSRSLDE